jgi:hypothetical protein
VGAGLFGVAGVAGRKNRLNFIERIVEAGLKQLCLFCFKSSLKNTDFIKNMFINGSSMLYMLTRKILP